MRIVQVFRWLAALLLVAAVYYPQADSSYHTAMLWIVSTFALATAIHYLSTDGNLVGWLMLGIAVVFNPIVPLQVGHQLWVVLCLASAVVFVIPRGRSDV